MGWRLLSLQHVYSVDVTPRKTCCTSALLAAPKNERASHKNNRGSKRASEGIIHEHKRFTTAVAV